MFIASMHLTLEGALLVLPDDSLLYDCKAYRRTEVHQINEPGIIFDERIPFYKIHAVEYQRNVHSLEQVY
jgi:hypothetical protein